MAAQRSYQEFQEQDYIDSYDYNEQVEYYQSAVDAYYAFSEENESFSPIEDEQERLDNEAIAYVAPRQYKRRFRNISRLERILAVTIVFVTLSFGIATIFIRAQISSTINQTTAVESENNERSSQINELRQQVNELSTAERVQAIAKERGLELHDNNLARATADR